MQEYVFNMQNDADRPIIMLDSIFPGCTALIDTGAIIPVWTKDVELLKELGAQLVKKDVSFSGFGGETKGDLYKLDLQLAELFYPGLPIVVHENNKIPGFFIFSATMFNKMIYTIDDIRKQFEVRIEDNQICRNLSLQMADGRVVVLVNQ